MSRTATSRRNNRNSHSAAAPLSSLGPDITQVLMSHRSLVLGFAKGSAFSSCTPRASAKPTDQPLSHNSSRRSEQRRRQRPSLARAS